MKCPGGKRWEHERNATPECTWIVSSEERELAAPAIHELAAVDYALSWETLLSRMYYD
jgi:hypothetical protein